MTVGLEPTVSLRSVKFAIVVQMPWSGICTRCSPTNSRRFRLRRTAHWADASLVCPVDVFTSRCRRFEVQADITQKQDHHEGDPVLRGDSWTRTNDPIDVNDVLYRLSHATGTGVIIHDGGGMVKAFLSCRNVAFIRKSFIMEYEEMCSRLKALRR